MELSAPELSLLRALDRWSEGADAASGGSVEAASWSAFWGGVTVGLLACRTPAWTERHVRILDRLITKLGGRAEVTATELPLGVVLVLHGLRSMVLADHQRAGRRRPTGPGDTDAPEPDELAALAADLLRRSIPPGMSGSSDVSGDAVIEGALLGLGLWLHDRRHHTDWHARSFEPWWADTTDVANAAAGSNAATLAWLLTPQAPAAAAPLLDRMSLTGPPLPDSPMSAGWPNADASQHSVLALRLLLAREWSLEKTSVTGAQRHAGPEGTGADADRDGQGDDPRRAWEALLNEVAATVAIPPGCWAALCRAPVATSGQLVDVEFPRVAISRAEWINGFLHVGLDVEDPDGPLDSVSPSRRTTFRIVGAEPRVWWASGMPNITTEMSATSVSVTVPLGSGSIEFAPSSY